MVIKRFIRCNTAILLIASALFVLVSLISYSSQDPPFANFPMNKPVKNLCGMAGAQIAGFIIAGLGRTSYLIVIFLGLLGTIYLYKEFIEYLWVRVIGFVLLLFSIASLITLVCYVSKKSLLSANVGGIFGIVIASRLYEYFNLIGALIILISGLIISIMLLINATPASLFIKISDIKKNDDTLEPLHNSPPRIIEALVPSNTRELDNTSAVVNNSITTYQKMETIDVPEKNDPGGKKQPLEPFVLPEKIQKPLDQEQSVEEEEVDAYPLVSAKNKERTYDLPTLSLL